MPFLPSASLLQRLMNGFEVVLDFIFLCEHHASVILASLLLFFFRHCDWQEGGCIGGGAQVCFHRRLVAVSGYDNVVITRTELRLELFVVTDKSHAMAGTGELSRQLTTFTNRVTNWELPEAAEDRRSRYRIYSVLRDGRGGSDSMWFDVVVR